MAAIEHTAGFHNSTHRILGRRLVPFSASHSLALDAGGWEGAGTIAGILGFLRVCSLKPDGQGGLHGFPDRCKASLLDVLRAAVLTRPKWREKAVAKIESYLVDHGTAAEVSWPVGPGVKTEVFEGNAIIATVAAGVRSGVPFSLAWSMPFGALRSWTAHHEATDPTPHKVRPQIIDRTDEAARLEWHRRANAS